MIHDQFALIEAAAERGNSDAKDAAAVISDTLRNAFTAAKLVGFTLNGSDPCERVAEALAVWIKESAPRRFADMTGTRYTVSGLDCSAEGMERLRDQSEFILLAYPGAGTTPAELAVEWLNDIDSVMREDGFDYESAELAVKQWAADATESGYLAHKLAEIDSAMAAACSAGEIDGDADSPPFRLYVRDNAPESDA